MSSLVMLAASVFECVRRARLTVAAALWSVPEAARTSRGGAERRRRQPSSAASPPSQTTCPAGTSRQGMSMTLASSSP